MKTNINAIQLIPDLRDETVAFHLKQARKRWSRHHEVLAKYKGNDVIFTGDNEDNYLLLVRDNVILYLIKTHSTNMGGLRYGQQVMLIKNADLQYKPLIDGFASFAFFKILLRRYHLLLSDQMQTPSGAKMFKNLTAAALSKSKFVYLYDRRSSPNRWVQIRSIPDFQVLIPRIWGSSEGHRRMLLAVSDQEVLPTNPSIVIEKV